MMDQYTTNQGRRMRNTSRATSASVATTRTSASSRTDNDEVGNDDQGNLDQHKSTGLTPTKGKVHKEAIIRAENNAPSKKNVNANDNTRAQRNLRQKQGGGGGEFLSLSCGAVSVATLLILITACVVLAATIAYSLKAADEFAESYSQANIVAAVSKVNDFVGIPLNTYSEIKLATHLGYMPNLVTGTNYIDTDNHTNATAVALLDIVRRDMYMEWLTRMQAMVFAANFNLLYVGIGLEDGSWLSCTVTNAARFAYDVVFINPRNATHELFNAAQIPPRTNKYRYARRFTNRTMPNSPYETHSTSTLNPPARPWYVNAPKGPLDDPIFSNVYPDFTLGVSIVDVNGPLYTQDGVFLGVTSLSLELRRISYFLSQLPKTANSITALVDGQGFLLAASDENALSTTTKTFNPILTPTSAPLAAGCDQFLNSTSGLASIVCRHTPGTYTNHRLRSLFHEYPFVFNVDGQSYTKKLKVDGESCMVSKAPISAKNELVKASIKWQMYTVMPVSDVTKQIVTGRNVGIIIACVIVAVSCASCVVALYFLLKPLSLLADLMVGASELNDETLNTQLEKSRFREISAIQDSFGKLSQQLQRAKSFLPAALLAQLESSMDDEDEGSGADQIEEDNQTGIASSYARNVRDAVSNGRETYASSSTNATKYGSVNRRMRGGAGAARKPGGRAADGFEGTKGPNNDQQTSTTTGLKVLSSSVSLTSKTVTIAALNLRDFHASLNSPLHSGSFEASYGQLVDAFQTTAKEHRGILDSFHGDRFFFTFNVVRPCGTHAAMAATAMLQIVALVKHHNTAHLKYSADQNNNNNTNNVDSNPTAGDWAKESVTCGIATGRCHVGNLGSDRAKRFSVIGHAFSFATVLERLCKNYPQTPILMSQQTSMDCETTIGYLTLDAIRTSNNTCKSGNVYGSGNGGVCVDGSGVKTRDNNITLVSAALYAKGVFSGYDARPSAPSTTHQAVDTDNANNKIIHPYSTSSYASPTTSQRYQQNNDASAVNDEWMYEILESSEKCNFQYANNAFRAVLSGDAATAQKNIDLFKDDNPLSLVARERIVSLIEDMTNGKPVSPANLGLFYDRCVLASSHQKCAELMTNNKNDAFVNRTSSTTVSPSVRVFDDKPLDM